MKKMFKYIFEAQKPNVFFLKSEKKILDKFFLERSFFLL